MNTRATAISLNSIDEKVRQLEGTTRTTPIDIKSLDDRINNLIATAKSWEIVTLTRSKNSYSFDSKYADWNFVVLNGKIEDGRNTYAVTISNNGKSYESRQNSSAHAAAANMSYSKSGNTITASSAESDTITVLFYK